MASAARPNSTNGSRHSSVTDGFALTGPSNLPDPSTHAYRKDLADAALAGQVIASHYAEPLKRHIISSAAFLTQPKDDAESVGQLSKGDEIRTLDIRAGWAWAYGPDGRVGYVRAEAVAP